MCGSGLLAAAEIRVCHPRVQGHTCARCSCRGSIF